MEFLILFISLTLMVYGANLLVNGSVVIANRLKIPEFITGALIVGVGTSLPELTVSLNATINGLNDISIGNVVGSNIFNILFILGISGLLYPMTINDENKNFDIPFCVIVSLAITLFAFNFFINNQYCIGRIDGIVLLSLFCLYVYKSFKNNINNNNIESIKEPIYKTIIKTIIGLILLIINCDIFIESAVDVARKFNISEAFISLTIISCGTSLPEMISSITAVIKKKNNIAIGNIIGSNIFNITFILGLCSIIKPLNNNGITIMDYIIMIMASIIILFCGFKNKINRLISIVMIILFILYIIILYFLN